MKVRLTDDMPCLSLISISFYQISVLSPMTKTYLKTPDFLILFNSIDFLKFLVIQIKQPV